MTKWEYESIHCESRDFDRFGQREWELVSIDDGIAYFKRPIVEDIEMPMEVNAPLVENLEMKRVLDKLKVVFNGLKFVEGYCEDWQNIIEEVTEEVLGVIND